MRFAANAYLMIDEYLEELYEVLKDDRLVDLNRGIKVTSKKMFENHNKIYNPGFIDAYYKRNELNFCDELKEHISAVRRLNLEITMIMYKYYEIITDVKSPILDSKYSKIQKSKKHRNQI